MRVRSCSSCIDGATAFRGYHCAFPLFAGSSSLVWAGLRLDGALQTFASTSSPLSILSESCWRFLLVVKSYVEIVSTDKLFPAVSNFFWAGAVTTCQNGKAALEKLRDKTHHFDLVLSDVYMPGKL
jgi:hypothetical protein